MAVYWMMNYRELQLVILYPLDFLIVRKKCLRQDYQ